MSDVVPGLVRGVNVLRVLQHGEGMSLDNLAAITGFPKASLTRMLNSLVQLGLAERNEEDRSYRALARLTPLGDEVECFDQELQMGLDELARATGVTAEWFVPSASAITLAQRSSAADALVRVLARVGFAREWNGELDSVAATAYALWEKAPKISTRPAFWHYDTEGERIPFPKDQWKKRIDAIVPAKPIRDMEFNPNGILRMACGVMRQGDLTGILTLAMPFVPGFEKRCKEREKALAALARQLTQ
ncbi:MAG: helix-turn-helix domain-containing protein [Planctomycetota bacterium]|jgi:DNA-binding IclR family transcriptional regulator